MSHTYDYPRPNVTVDVAFFTVPDDTLEVLLIQRKHDPFCDRWATPGGFIEMDEELEDSARRELLEETGLEVGTLHPFGMFGKVGRDPRGRTISAAFLTLHAGPPPRAEAGDDASAAEWFRIDRLPKLAFDHDVLLRNAVGALRQQAELSPLAFDLLPKRFTLRRLQTVYEAILGHTLEPRRFRRRALGTGVLEETAMPRQSKGREQWYRLSRQAWRAQRDPVRLRF